MRDELRPAEGKTWAPGLSTRAEPCLRIRRPHPPPSFSPPTPLGRQFSGFYFRFFFWIFFVCSRGFVFFFLFFIFSSFVIVPLFAFSLLSIPRCPRIRSLPTSHPDLSSPLPTPYALPNPAAPIQNEQALDRRAPRRPPADWGHPTRGRGRVGVQRVLCPSPQHPSPLPRPSHEVPRRSLTW